MNKLSNMKMILVFVSLMLLSACAANPPRQPQIQRISAEELEKLLPPPVALISTQELVILAKQGISAEDIIKKIQDTKSQYALTPSQYLELAQQGVPTKVLDYIQTAHEQLLKDAFAEELNKRELAKQQEQEKLKKQLLMQRNYPYYDPFWGPSPYWGMGPYWGYRYPHGPGFYYRFGR
jgi:hypothetical protein